MSLVHGNRFGKTLDRYIEGYEDAEAGYDKNPYRSGTEHYDLWFKGWCQFHEEYQVKLRRLEALSSNRKAS